jgi:hypothetical protein
MFKKKSGILDLHRKSTLADLNSSLLDGIQHNSDVSDVETSEEEA